MDERHDQPAPAHEARRPDIQGLRAVAVILVVAFHAGLPVTGGFVGVDVFLVISGFVIVGTLTRELERTGTIQFLEFYGRRIKRLAPALALVVATVALLSALLGSSLGPQQTTARTGLGATFFSANLVLLRFSNPYWDVDSWVNPLLHTWTLSVEEQVYLIFPAVLLASWTIGRRWLGGVRFGMGTAVATVAALSFAFSLWTSSGRGSGVIDNPAVFAFYSSFTRIWEFAAGAAIALAMPYLRRLPATAAAFAGITGVVAIGIAATSFTGSTRFPGFAALLPVFGASAVIVAGFCARAAVPRVLSARPLTFIGDLSYAWYLWHWPVLVFARIIWPASPVVLATAAAFSLLPAWLSTIYLENPIRFSPVFAGRRLVALAATCTLVPAALCLLLLKGADASWGSATLAEMQRQILPEPSGQPGGCQDGLLPPASSCKWNTSATGPGVYVIGDSTAGQYGKALIGAASSVGGPLTIHTSSGCDFGPDTCSGYVASTVDWLVDQPPGIVVLSSYWYGLGAEGTVTELEAIVGRLRAAGHKVVLVLPTPHFLDRLGDEWFPHRCPNILAMLDTARCGQSVNESQARRDRSAVADALEAVAGATGATTLDLFAQLCANGVCSTNIGNRWMFHDGVHITAAQSEALAPAFVVALER